MIVLKGAILDKGEKFYTHMSRIFKAIHGAQNEYNWLIANFEAYPDTPKFIEYVNSSYTWLAGNELAEMVEAEDFQWIWAVLSGFPKSVTKKQVLQYDLPSTEYMGYWENPLNLQHPLARLEIVPFDSSFVLVISKDDEVVNDFLASMPFANDLGTHIIKGKT